MEGEFAPGASPSRGSYYELIDYKKNYGNCHIPLNFPQNRALDVIGLKGSEKIGNWEPF